MSLFYIKCECGNKISKFVWNQKLEKTKDGKSEYTNICKKCGNKYIKSNNIFLKWFGEGILGFHLAIVVTFVSSIYINDILNIFIVFFIFLILFIFLEILIANIGYKKYLEKI